MVLKSSMRGYTKVPVKYFKGRAGSYLYSYCSLRTIFPRAAHTSIIVQGVYWPVIYRGIAGGRQWNSALPPSDISSGSIPSFCARTPSSLWYLAPIVCLSISVTDDDWESIISVKIALNHQVFLMSLPCCSS